MGWQEDYLAEYERTNGVPARLIPVKGGFIIEDADGESTGITRTKEEVIVMTERLSLRPTVQRKN